MFHIVRRSLKFSDPAELKKKLTNSFEILSANQQRDVAAASGRNDYEEYSYDEEYEYQGEPDYVSGFVCNISEYLYYHLCFYKFQI